MPILGTLRRCALAAVLILPASAHAQQTTVNFGSATVKLKRVNTMSGAANANPLYGTSAPGDSKLYLVQQGTDSPTPDVPGRVRYIDPTVVDGTMGTLLDFGTQLPNVLDISHFEKGLLGLAFHPDFADPAKPGYLRFYTYSNEARTAHGSPDYIHAELAPDPATRVNNLAVLREWTANAVAATSATPSRVVLKVADPQNQHNGGTIAFSPTDGYLYWALGDGGGNSSNSPDFVGAINSATDGHTNAVGNLPHGNGQDRTNPFGDMLRINPLREQDFDDPNAVASPNGQYQIPSDNPFTMASNINPETSQPYPAWDPAWLDEIYAYGLRNPYRFSFDRGVSLDDPNRGKLYVGDAGYNDREEVDLIVPGGNYGWVIREGTESMQGVQGIPAYTAPPNAVTGLPDTLLDPVAEYFETIGIATIGGFVSRTPNSTLNGKFIFGDNASPLTGGNAILLYFDVNEAKAPEAPFTIFRLSVSAQGAALPAQDLLGFAEGPAGQIYALFDNGQIFELLPQPSADFDNDFDVDGADFARWSAAFGEGTTADADKDGDSDGADFLAWQRQFGAAVAAVPAGNEVPEPGLSTLLASIAACSAAAFARKRR